MVRHRVMDLRGWFIAGLLASTGTCVAAQNQTQTRGLHSLFVASGKLFFGTATDARNFNDAPYLEIANDTNEFGLWVPENSQKWQPTEPEQNNFAFGDPDEVMRASKENRQMLRCHTLTWHSQLPNFGRNQFFFQVPQNQQGMRILIRISANRRMDTSYAHGGDPVSYRQRRGPLQGELLQLGRGQRSIKR